MLQRSYAIGRIGKKRVGVSQQTEDPIASSREISIEGQQLSYISNDVAPVVAKIVETAKLENFIVINRL